MQLAPVWCVERVAIVGVAPSFPQTRPGEDTVLGIFARDASVRLFRKQSTLITEGYEGSSLKLILSGRVKGCTRDASGKERGMSIREAGEILGKMALHGGLCNHSSRGGPL